MCVINESLLLNIEVYSYNKTN